jgi:gliding motility-associated-like protein
MRNLIFSNTQGPAVFLGNDTTLCSGDSLVLRNREPSNLDKQWQDGSDSDSLIVSVGGKYWLTELNLCGLSSDKINVGLSFGPNLSIGEDTTICFGDMITLEAVTDGYQVVWNDYTASFTFDVYDEGIYWATSKFVTDGCTTSDSVLIEFEDCEDFELHMPNVFTPNGDSLNDYFRPIVFKKVNEAVLSVYNRWGEKIFETYNVERGWNGQYEGKPVPDGVYFWLLEYIEPKEVNPQKVFINGTVTLIR